MVLEIFYDDVQIHAKSPLLTEKVVEGGILSLHGRNR